MQRKNTKVFKQQNSKKYRYKWDYCNCGKRTTSMLGNIHMCPACKHKMKRLDDKFNSEDYGDYSEEDYRILSQIKKHNVSEESIKSLLKAAKRGVIQEKEYTLPKEHIRALVFGDTHIGNKAYNPGLMNLAAKEAKKEKVDVIFCTGDIADGWYQNRPASIFEQNAIGFDNQLEMAVKEFKKLKDIAPLYFITGNHEYNTYVRGAGVEFGNILQTRLEKEGMENYYIGNAEGDVRLRTGTKIKLIHPDGGSSYAISYKSQKIIESLQSNDSKLPDVALIGHFHKQEYIQYMGTHTFQTGTFMDQTKFMRGKGIAAHMGFWIVDMYANKKGVVEKITPTWYSLQKK